MSTDANEKTEKTLKDIPDLNAGMPEIKLYSQNRIFYWWPVWLTGFIMALITYFGASRVQTERLNEYVHPSANLGIIWVLAVVVVIVFTNFSFRGAASFAAVVGAILLSVIFALLGWWDKIFNTLSYLSVHMNIGFYLLISSFLFVIWIYAFLIDKRLDYYRVRPGQISEVRFIGEGETNYDTRGAVLEKRREDLFRNGILGFGGGDITITTTGARNEELIIKDLLFVDRKLKAVRKLITIQPDDLADVS